jgi:hypothetical protein
MFTILVFVVEIIRQHPQLADQQRSGSGAVPLQIVQRNTTGFWL